METQWDTFAGRISWAMEKSGMGESDLARAVGVSQPTVNHWAKAGKKSGYTGAIARALGVNADWLATGAGHPSQGIPEPNVRNPGDRIPVSLGVMPRDMPVRGASACGEGGDFIMNGEIIDYIRRPPALENNRAAFAVYCQGESMAPWRQSGDPVYVNPSRPARAGDYVLVEMAAPEGEVGKSYIKRLVALTATQVVLEQYNPPRKDIKLKRDAVKSIFRIMDWPELMGV